MVDKTAIILAGGKGSRLGYVDKAFLEYKGEFFIDILLRKLKNFKEIIVVTNSSEKYLSYEKNCNYIGRLKIIPDKVKEIGPLGGIYTGVFTSKYNESLVISCDTPFISEEFIKYMEELKGDYSIALPIYRERKEPLCALYKKNIIEIIEKKISEKNYKIDSIFLKEHTKYLDIEEIFQKEKIENIDENFIGENINILERVQKGFYNINTQEELERINSREE